MIAIPIWASIVADNWLVNIKGITNRTNAKRLQMMSRAKLKGLNL
jgi:hypothetical protein